MGNSKIKMYTTVLAIICFVVAALMAITPFLPLFRAEFWGFVESERGIDFLIPSSEIVSERVEYDEDGREITHVEFEKKGILESEILEGIDNAKFWNGAMFFGQVVLFCSAVFLFFGGIGFLRALPKKETAENFCKSNIQMLVIFIMGPLLYYVTVLYVLSKLNDYGEGIVEYTSSIHATMIIAILVTIIGLVVNNLIRQSVNDMPSVEMENQDNSITLITKYKELLDNGIITEEEFDMKKKELLGKGEIK